MKKLKEKRTKRRNRNYDLKKTNINKRRIKKKEKIKI